MNEQDMEYLGDGVYIGHDGYQVWLTIGSHLKEKMIALDPNVLRNLVRYAENKLNLKLTGVKK